MSDTITVEVTGMAIDSFLETDAENVVKLLKKHGISGYSVVRGYDGVDYPNGYYDPEEWAIWHLVEGEYNVGEIVDFANVKNVVAPLNAEDYTEIDFVGFSRDFIVELLTLLRGVCHRVGAHDNPFDDYIVHASVGSKNMDFFGGDYTFDDYINFIKTA